jgi:hypothetical protein
MEKRKVSFLYQESNPGRPDHTDWAIPAPAQNSFTHSTHKLGGRTLTRKEEDKRKRIIGGEEGRRKNRGAKKDEKKMETEEKATEEENMEETRRDE